MTFLAEQLEQIDRQFAAVLAAGGDDEAVSDDELVTVLQVLGRVQRRVGGAITRATERVVERDQGERVERLSSRVGCRDAGELLRRALRVDGHTARRYVTAAGAVHRERDLTSGRLLLGAFPELSAALADGEVSLSGFLECVVPLQKAVRIGTADRWAADAVLARFARGLPLDADEGSAADAVRGPAPTTDELAGVAAHLVARLDPDGAEPRDRAGKRRRFFTIGKLRDGSVPVRGELLPEVAAQLQTVMDSLMNPKADGEETSGGIVRFRPSADEPERGDSDSDSDSDDASSDDHRGRPSDAYSAENSTSGTGSTSGVDPAYDVTRTGGEPGSAGPNGPGGHCGSDPGRPAREGGVPAHRAQAPPVECADLRTQAQKRHDAFATILMVAAATDTFPHLGGAAPTLVVSVRAEDFTNRTGRATVGGTGYDVPLGAAEHAACAGGVQRVLFDEHGAIAAISTTARIFNARQRRAIILRDRQCLIPGCGIRAQWCEIHHVSEHAHGGPTHTSNGVALCWHHHRTLDENTWQIRMRTGRPEIRGPHWWDPYGLWRAPHLDDEAIDETLTTEREHQHETAWNTW